MRSITRLVPLASLLILLALLATACGPASPAALSDDEMLAVTSNVLSAIDADDYAAFTRDFSDEMLAAFPESQFTQMGDLLQGSSGNFVACGEFTLSNKQGFALYRIICEYELEDVVVTIVFKIDGTQVEGLFFDSPNLRTASQ
jgi:hypothetical protein